MSSIEKAIARLSETAGAIPQQDVAAPSPSVVGKEDKEQQLVTEEKTKLELNFEALAQTGYLTPNTMQSSLAEEYRLLKRSLLLHMSGIEPTLIRYGNLVVITSPLAGEGKTFTSFNLAMSIATGLDTTAVLLIDCDLMGRSLTNLVGLGDASGLTDILSNSQVNLHDVIIHTNIPKFNLIPAGHAQHDAMELLASAQMRDMAYELSTHYSDCIVLFDAPSLLAASQALALTTFVGQILVVVEEGKTPQQAIKEVISLLDENKSVGMVLNKCYR